MFSYYGSKSKIAKHYPKPKHDLIIEPFAGAAWYSILHRNKKVLLNEKYDILFNTWKWLIEEADADVILSNSDFYSGQDIRDLSLPDPLKNLIGFCINRGSVSPANVVQIWSCQVKSNPYWASTVNYQLKRVANILHEIKHWDINFGDYKDIPNIEATWFIDPPYQYGGEHYKVNNINYNDLADWCNSRRGQVIVCENSKAKWLPFRPLIETHGQRPNKGKSLEVMFYKDT